MSSTVRSIKRAKMFSTMNAKQKKLRRNERRKQQLADVHEKSASEGGLAMGGLK